MDRSSEEVFFIASSFGPHVDADSEFDESDVSETSLQLGDSMKDEDYEESEEVTKVRLDSTPTSPKEGMDRPLARHFSEATHPCTNRERCDREGPHQLSHSGKFRRTEQARDRHYPQHQEDGRNAFVVWRERTADSVSRLTHRKKE